MYAQPAAKRAAEMPHGGSPQGAAAPTAPVLDAAAGVKREIEAGKAPNRAAMVNLLMMFGMKRQDAHEEYDRQYIEWQRLKGGAT